MDIGVIGGADGPSTVLVASAANKNMLTFVVPLIFVLGIMIWYLNNKNNNKE